MGRQSGQPLHVLKAGVEVAAGDHGPAERLEQLSGDIDQLIFHRCGIGSASHHLAAGKTGAIQGMLVGHQAGQAVAIGFAGGVAVVGEQPQPAIGRPLSIGVLGHHENREVIRDVLRQHAHLWTAGIGTPHAATLPIIWWCST